MDKYIYIYIYILGLCIRNIRIADQPADTAETHIGHMNIMNNNDSLSRLSIITTCYLYEIHAHISIDIYFVCIKM